MNRDGGQYFLSRAFDEILMKKNPQMADQLATLKVLVAQHYHQKTVNISLITVMI